MVGFTFENQGVNTYLVYSIGAEEVLDTLSLGMTTNNKISGILPIVFTQMDDDKYFKYNISSKVSVKQFFTGAVNKKRLLGVLSSIISGILAAEEYMIDTSTLVFDLDYIFADVSTCEAWMVCLPVLNAATEPLDLSLFFKSIVFSTQFDQTENCDYVARIISYLNSTQMFSLVDFKRIVDELLHGLPSKPVNAVLPVQSVKQQVTAIPQQSAYSKPQIPEKPAQAVKQVQQTQAVPKKAAAAVPPAVTAEPAKKPAANMGFAIPGMENETKTPQKAEGKKEKAKKEKVSKEKEKVQKEKKSLFSLFIKKSSSAEKSAGKEMSQKELYQEPVPAVIQTAPEPVIQQLSFGETTVLGGSGAGETTVLNNAQPMNTQPFLIRGRNNERIYVNKPVFRIGKEKSYVDYFVADNTSISRSHANIITRENEYYVIDTNSTNHTYVNGAMLQSNVEVKIEHGTKIRFANEEFEFRLY